MWKILAIIAAILMVLSFVRRQNTIWGGATIGLIVGVIIAMVKNFNWSITYKAVVIGILVGFIADLLGMLSDFIKNKE
jgi:thiamine transporter ThiT